MSDETIWDSLDRILGMAVSGARATATEAVKAGRSLECKVAALEQKLRESEAGAAELRAALERIAAKHDCEADNERHPNDCWHCTAMAALSFSPAGKRTLARLQAAEKLAKQVQSIAQCDDEAKDLEAPTYGNDLAVEIIHVARTALAAFRATDDRGSEVGR